MKKTIFFRATLSLALMVLGNLPLKADDVGYGLNVGSCESSARGSDRCNSHIDVVYCGKKYIPMEKIVLIDHSILIEFEGEIFETPALYSDSHGFYIENVKIADQGNCGHLQWQCNRCSQCNSLFYSCCAKCNRHISDKRDCK